MRRALCLAAVLVVAAGACSSTTARDVPRDVAAPVDPGDVDPEASPSPSAGPASTVRSRREPARRAEQRGTPAARAAAPGVARTGGELKIGVIVPSGNPGAAFGIPVQQDPEATERAAKALVDEINATGGIAGRRVKVVVARNDRTDESEMAQTRIQNEICARLTEDEKVFMVLPFYGTYFANQCYVRHRTAVLGTGFPGDEKDFKALSPWFLPPLSLNASRMARLLPEVWKQQGFLTKSMGMIAFDVPYQRRTGDNILVPGIARRGGKVIEKVYMAVSYQEVGAAMASAVLRFRQRGVDRVIVWATSNGAWLIFSKQAEAQGYRPRYGISTYNDPAGYFLFDQAQLEGSMGAGYYPGWDMRNAYGPLSPKEKACFAILNRRGGSAFKDRGQGTDTAPIIALRQCDVFFQLRAALRPAAAETLVNTDAVRYMNELGTGYQPITVPSSRFAPGRPDGIDAYADLKFDARCPCYRYTSKFKKIPAGV